MDKTKIKAKVKKLMKQNNWSLRDVARVAQVSPETVRSFLKGGNVRRSTLKMLSYVNSTILGPRI